METKKSYIRFDWAMKRLLRNKANFSVLEGFLTTLLNEKITIKSLLESEGNMETEDSKSNRVDLLAEDSKGRLIIIEVQNANEYAYFQRILFGTSKLITDYINKGMPYDNVCKIYSVNILYFSLNSATDTVYHGKTEFRGIHDNDILNLSPFQQQKFSAKTAGDLYPEYYILNVSDFNKVATTPLEEWMHYLNTGELSDDASAPGLDGVRKNLKLESMTKTELKWYYYHLDNQVILKDGRENTLLEGRMEGLEQGRVEGIEQGIKEGIKEEKLKNAKSMLALNLPIKIISEVTGLTEDEINLC